jgi:hypothetical protein
VETAPPLSARLKQRLAHVGGLFLRILSPLLSTMPVFSLPRG